MSEKTTIYKRKRRIKRKTMVRIIKILIIVLVFAMIYLFAFLKLDYLKRPGVIDLESFTATERGTNHIELEWTKVRNTDYYNLLYRAMTDTDDVWSKVEIASENDNNAINEGGEQKITGTVYNLKPGTEYEFKIQPINDKKEGIITDSVVVATRKLQSIEIGNCLTKMTTSKAFKIHAEAKTRITYESSNKSIATIDRNSGRIEIKNAGETIITARAEESDDYTAAAATFQLRVIDMYGSSTDTSARIVYTLNESNCSKVISITGDDGIQVPQSFAYTDDKYIIAYCNGKGSSTSKIITFDSSGNKLSVRGTKSLGHPNGFTYNPNTKLCYSLRGNTNRVDTYDIQTNMFGVTSMAYGAAGIAYDDALNLIYTTSRTGVRTYSADGHFTYKKHMSNCTHSKHMYTQDCGAYNGLVFRCMSGSDKHGLNYIDIYDTRSSQYMGSFAVYLGEVESAIVNNEGFLLLLVNTSGKTDYIYDTHINVKSLSE